MTEGIASHSIDDNNSPSIEDQIAYHKQMEYIANKVGDFTKADHHRKMQEILQGVKRKGAREN